MSVSDIGYRNASKSFDLASIKSLFKINSIMFPTIKKWVPLPTSNPNILIVAENCPDESSYLYRKLPGSPIDSKGANNLLDNLCKTFGIFHISEDKRLDTFLNVKQLFLIDTYLDDDIWSKSTPHYQISTIHSAIVKLNPTQIIFTCKRSNIKIIQKLKCFESNLPKYQQIVSQRLIRNDYDNCDVFNSPSNRAFTGFQKQIEHSISIGKLIL